MTETITLCINVYRPMLSGTADRPTYMHNHVTVTQR